MTGRQTHLESILQSTQGSTCYAKEDMAHAYWQLPLADESQEMLSSQTPLRVYSSRRLLQGSTDAGIHFQAGTLDVFQGRCDSLLQRLDGFLLHAAHDDELLEVLQQFMSVCAEYGFKILAQNTKFCGRIISSDGVRFDPRHLDALISMKPPKSGD